jgi:hypothetical protein
MHMFGQPEQMELEIFEHISEQMGLAIISHAIPYIVLYCIKYGCICADVNCTCIYYTQLSPHADVDAISKTYYRICG